jgi:enediyne biosynthesis protein E4
VAGSGYLSQDDGRCTSGWARQRPIDKLIVHWPSGREQTLES